MTVIRNLNRLHKQLARMIALEAAIEQRLKVLITEVSDHAEATALLSGFLTMSREHRLALETRLNSLTGDNPPSSEPMVIYTASGSPEEAKYPVSSSLLEIYTLYNQAVIGYSVLHPLATRFLDSVMIADEGTSYHITRQHTQNYIQAIQQISRVLHDVVLWELDHEGYECQCICPSCSVGICLCSMAGRSFLSQAWEEARPIFDDEGIYVQQPKQDSAAVKAGLHRGDVILAAGGQEIESYGDLQGAVRNAESGEEVRLTVRRGSDELEEVAIVRS